ncbi:eukaryotic translation initiation factor 2 subunit beta-like [Salvia divinorum]|uniref:Eukaryotic translation initiation factor 2 subunit beta-like n=1 Tax=Salvia divinorum TaxID=28513 RepID=A0ABD1FXK5_SALDI
MYRISLQFQMVLKLHLLVYKKKKKKKVAHADLNEEKEAVGEDVDDTIGEDEEGEGIVLQQYPWEGSDRDYEYEELLERVFNILHENNPKLAGDRRRTVMRPPQDA